MKKSLSLIVCVLFVTVVLHAQNYTVAHGSDEHITNDIHYPKAVGVKGTQTAEFKLENIATAPGCAAYFDRTSTVFEVKAGDIITPSVTINGAWMHSFIFVDWSQNGQFEVNLLGDGPYTEGEGNELVSYSHYNMASSTVNNGWNSAGEAVGGNVLTPCTFRVPAHLAVGSSYRMRYSVTWNCARPDGDYPNFISDGGSIIDVTLKIVGVAENVQKYPIDNYEEPSVGDVPPAEQWNALSAGLHCSWANRNEHYKKHLVPELTETTVATVTAWKGERANIEAVLFSKEDQGTLRVRMTELRKNGEGTGIECATARFMNYIITDDGRGCGDHNFSLPTWLVPDVIEQPDKAKVVNACETRPVWCSIEVPRNIDAGTYSTAMEVVNEAGDIVKTLDLTIEVVDRALPKAADRKFHLDLWQQPYAVSRYYEVPRWSDEHIAALRPYLEALGKAGQSVVTTILFYEPWGEQSHDKFSPMIQTTRKKDGTWAFNYDIFDKYVELCNECGINKQINCYSMVTWDMKFRYHDEATDTDVDWALAVGTKDYNEMWDAYLKAFRTHLEEKGWFDKTCIAMDERSESQMLSAYNIIRANGFKMALAGNYHSSLNDKLYDYCVALGQGGRFTDAERKYRKDNNLLTTVYTCCTESEPNIFSNSLPAEAAFLPIHVAANGLDGYLHWSWINWDEHPLTDTRFRKFGAGDTYCYYPGNRSSVRFERLVEGIQQFEKIQIMKREMAGDATWMETFDKLLGNCKDFFTSGAECAGKVDRLEAFLNGKEVDMPEDVTGYWKIKVDDTHYAKSAANQTEWETELSAQAGFDLFLIEGDKEACTIKLMGRTNNIGPDNSRKLFVDQTATTKYSIVDAADGKVKLKNNGYWVYVDNGTFTWNATKSTELQLEFVMPYKKLARTTLFSTLNGGMDIPPYRIPGITCGKNGRLIASAARLVCGTDPGFGQVDCVVKISDDNGITWSEQEIEVAVGDATLINNVKTPMEAAYGDPAVVFDREHNEALVMAVAGCTVYTSPTTNRQNPNMIAAIRSLDGGNTWEMPIDQTEHIYGLFDSGKPLAAAFVGGGKVFQSRVVKVGAYYRLYAALDARPGGNRIIYSDDFGRSWKALGGASATPVPDGDEPKCEELPDGRVIVTSRTGGGRLMNIYTYSNTRTGAGKWEAQVKATMSGLSASPSTNPTNGEMLIVPAQRTSDGMMLYVALQSVPTGSGRNNVGIFYKELADADDIRNVTVFTDAWDGFYQVSSTASAYSSLDLQADDKIGFFYEETLTKWGVKPNPVSTSFPTGSGTHNFDGFENVYVALDLEMITSGKYTVNRNVNRGDYLKNYFNSIIDEADMPDDEKNAARAEVAKLSNDPAMEQIDAIYGLIEGAEPADKWDGKVLAFTNVQQNNTERTLYIENGKLKFASATVESLGESAQFKCTKRENGKYSLLNENSGLYMIWRSSDAQNYGYNNNCGTLTGYNATYCDWVFADASGTKANTYYLVSKRADGSTDGSLVIMKSGVFDSYGASVGWNANYSNLFSIKVVDITTGLKVETTAEPTARDGKYLHNNSIVVIRNGVHYDTSGRRHN